MSAYKNALMINESSTEEHLALAAQALHNCEAIVLLNSAVAFRSTPSDILCEIIDPMPTSHRCAQEFEVLVENAKHMLSNSKLAHWLPDKSLKWRVVEDCGDSVREMWPGLF
jgi:hypothetical protein